MDANETSGQLERLVEQISSHFYPTTPKVLHLESYGGAKVYRLDFDGVIQDRIIKLTVPGISEGSTLSKTLREQNILRELASRGFEVPDVEFTQDQWRHNDTVYTLMPFVQSRPWEDIYADNPGLMRYIFARQGQYIARLSRQPPSAFPSMLNTAEAIEREEGQWQWACNGLRLQHDSTYGKLQEAMREVKTLLTASMTGLVNRDGLQICTDGIYSFAVIDWDAAGPGHRLRDLGIVIGQHLVHRKGALSNAPWCDWLLNGYLQGKIENDIFNHQLSLLTIYYLVTDAIFASDGGNVERAEDILKLAVAKLPS